MKDIESKYMMATIAIHLLGDISREDPGLCVVYGEDEENYIGAWVMGFGFYNVKFPKSTTRDLTTEEVEKYHGMVTTMGGGLGPTINIKGEDFSKEVIITKAGSGEVYTGTLIAPVLVGKIIAMINMETGRMFHSSQIQSISGNEVKTRNSTYSIKYV